jgi:5'-AMP-activated protein kinase regulatory gamma subunit
MQMGIVSAPMWDSKTSTFAGLITANDYINVIQYYWQNPDKVAEIDKMRLRSLPGMGLMDNITSIDTELNREVDIEKAIGVTPVETISIHPDRPLYEALRRMLQSRARRIPLVDIDDETQRPMVVSVITQYRILKFISTNVKDVQLLKKPLIELKNVGTYTNLQSVSMTTPVIDVIHLLVKHNISSLPIVDENSAYTLNR